MSLLCGGGGSRLYGHTYFWRENVLIVQLFLDPGHQVVNVFWCWTLDGLLHSGTVSPVILVSATHTSPHTNSGTMHMHTLSQEWEINCPVNFSWTWLQVSEKFCSSTAYASHTPGLHSQHGRVGARVRAGLLTLDLHSWQDKIQLCTVQW